ncbi:MAG: hypothetical protein ACOY5B_15640 [Spirochaetota bacterium]
MQRSKALVLGAVALLVVGSITWWLTNYSGAERQIRRPEPRPLASYREQFRRSDGLLPADAELRQILQAKGIPYQESCPAGQDCSAGGTTAVSAIPQVEFIATGISSAQRDELRTAIAAALGSQLDELRRNTPELRLERVAVDSGMKLQLYFNQQFVQVADDETRLNDFSEALHSLGLAGLRGSVVYIDGQPLGLYLQKKDAERNREARRQSPETSPDGRR